MPSPEKFRPLRTVRGSIEELCEGELQAAGVRPYLASLLDGVLNRSAVVGVITHENKSTTVFDRRSSSWVVGNRTSLASYPERPDVVRLNLIPGQNSVFRVTTTEGLRALTQALLSGHGQDTGVAPHWLADVSACLDCERVYGPPPGWSFQTSGGCA